MLGIADSSSRMNFSAGERPVRFEIDGGFPNSDGELELRIHQVASVIRFERDPEMDADMFAVGSCLTVGARDEVLMNSK